jgi:hypothetical protein
MKTTVVAFAKIYILIRYLFLLCTLCHALHVCYAIHRGDYFHQPPGQLLDHWNSQMLWLRLTRNHDDEEPRESGSVTAVSQGCIRKTSGHM